MESSASLISVVIPAYNTAGYVGEALESVFRQTYGRTEVIVVNDGSPDTEALERVLEPVRDRIVYLRQENQGPSAARNAGIRRARGELVAFLDSDDAWEPAFLAEQLALLTGPPAYDLVYCDAILFGSGPLVGQRFMEACPSQGEATFAALARCDCTVLTSAVLVRREMLLDAGLFDRRFTHSEDFHLWLRIAHRGGRIGYQPKVLVRHRLRGDSLSGESESLVRSQRRIALILLDELELRADEAEPLRGLVAHSDAHLALGEAKRDLLAGNYTQAREALARAQAVLRSRKIALALLALRVAPGALRRLLSLRRRLARA